MGLVPSPGWEVGLEALDRLLEEKVSVSAAVAFVSRAGAGTLCALLDRHSGIEEVHIVARGAPITDPDALLMLKEKAGASISLLTGPEAVLFHPKLWLLEGEDGTLDVLSGSGNLTAGGLSDNREQFEVARVSDEQEIEAQWDRFAALTEGTVTLEEMLGSVAWKEWKQQLPERRQLAKRERQLDKRLAASAPKNMEEAKEALRRDLWGIHDRTLEEKLPKSEGGIYNPGYFRLELEGHRGVTDPVHIVGRICRRKTKGFDVIRDSGRWNLTVESLVVDPNKPYYELFKGKVRDLSEERLRQQFPDWLGPPPKR
jgi:hypothetical protein